MTTTEGTHITHTNPDGNTVQVHIGDNATIGDYVTIKHNVKIGRDVTIRYGVTICENVTIGDNSWIGDWARIGDGAHIRSKVLVAPQVNMPSHWMAPSDVVINQQPSGDLLMYNMPR